MDFMICPINIGMSTLMVISVNQSTISSYLFDLKNNNKKLIQIKITGPRKYCEYCRNILKSIKIS
jgi:hypothetical protein